MRPFVANNPCLWVLCQAAVYISKHNEIDFVRSIPVDFVRSNPIRSHVDSILSTFDFFLYHRKLLADRLYVDLLRR